VASEARGDSGKVDRSEIHTGRLKSLAFLMQSDKVKATVAEDHDEDGQS
jgi:hypothetical protein